MRKRAFSLITLALVLGIAVVTIAEDCPDCPKTPLSSPQDPNWKDFLPPSLAPGETPDCHRVQFGKQNCMECHKKDTPVAYQQWLASKHGINNVKCGTCHGDAVNYRAMPDKAVCIGCHSQQVDNMPASSPVTNCSFCHKVHYFTVHSIDKYKAFAPDRELEFKVPGF
jgi:hypothetical protein